jgi:hypothetical protein
VSATEGIAACIFTAGIGGAGRARTLRRADAEAQRCGAALVHRLARSLDVHVQRSRIVEPATFEVVIAGACAPLLDVAERFGVRYRRERQAMRLLEILQQA